MERPFDSIINFVNVSAEHGKSTSILAGDRNLPNDWAGDRTLVTLDANSYLRWTREMHRFKGNVLFADGHVEELNRPTLMVTSLDPVSAASLALPSSNSSSTSVSQDSVQPIGSFADPAGSVAPNVPLPNMPAARTTSATSAPLLLLLLLLAYLAFRLWQWEKRRMKQQRGSHSKR